MHGLKDFIIHDQSENQEMVVATFSFLQDVSLNNAFQIYRGRDLQPGELKLELLGFRGSIVETYFLVFCNKEDPSTLYRSNRSSEKVPEHIRTDKQEHWIAGL